MNVSASNNLLTIQALVKEAVSCKRSGGAQLDKNGDWKYSVIRLYDRGELAIDNQIVKVAVTAISSGNARAWAEARPAGDGKEPEQANVRAEVARILAL